MPEVTSRDGTPDDVESAGSVLAAAYAEYESAFPPVNWTRYLADILDLEGRAPESDLLLAELDGRVVGCVSYFRPQTFADTPSSTVRTIAS